MKKDNSIRVQIFSERSLMLKCTGKRVCNEEKKKKKCLRGKSAAIALRGIKGQEGEKRISAVKIGILEQ